MQLHRIEPRLPRQFGGGDELRNHPGHIRFIHGPLQDIALEQAGDVDAG